MSGGSGRVVAVVPAKDRADSVGATVAALFGIAEVSDVLVVDDGSTDETATEARRAGAWVLRLPENRGKGGAVAAAVEATPETDVYLLVDADTGSSATAAAALLPPVLGGEADMTVAVLPAAGGRGGFGLVRRLAAAGIRRGTGGFVAHAPLSGQRAVRGTLLRSLALAPRFGLEVGLTVDARRVGAHVAEMPVAMEHRHTGRGPAGFVHRGRQGVDATRALWPRLTSARNRIALVVLGLVVAVLAATWSGSRWPPTSVPPTAPAAKVLLVGVPGLRWDELGTGTMPNLDLLAAAGAVGAMTVRTGSARPQVQEGYASLGAGSRVRAGEAADDAVADSGRVLVPAAAALRTGAGRYLPTLPGALGDALHAAGRRTAVVGNADLAPGLAGPQAAGYPTISRPAAVALMDHTGLVDAGTVAPGDLLVDDPHAPFGRRADIPAVVDRVDAALARADVVLVDPGDFDRSAALSTLGAPDWFVAVKRAEALTAVDDLLGRLTADLPSSTLLLVVSVVPPTDEWRLTPVVASGAGVVHGYLSSPSTRRLGLVTLTDVAPTVLSAVGAPVPAAMVGAPLRYHPGTPDLSRLARLDRDTAYRERIWLPVAAGFVAFQVLAWLLVGLVVAGRLAWVRRSWLRTAALAVAAFAPATFLFRALPAGPGLGAPGLILLVALDAAVVAVASLAHRRPLSPLAWIYGVTAGLLAVDVATGARLQLGGILGYAPQTASRFSGLGNTGFAVLAAAGLLAAALHVDHAPRRGEALAAVAAFLALLVFVDGAPSLGDDVGGILTLVPVVALALLALAGRRLTWRRVAVVVAVTVAVVGLATAVDLARPPSSRTHLGRLAAETLHHGQGSLVTTAARKASVDLRSLRQSVFTAVVPLIALGMLVLLFGGGRLRDSAIRDPALFGDVACPGAPLRIGVVAALAAGLVGFALNDSGVVVTAVVLAEIGPLLALLALRDRPAPVALLEPDGDAARPGASSALPPGLPAR
ncbi:MAG: glycosyltransferase [Actinomycetota bacterium]|nr:glycosyltransferase [Actinomycetota bacterium]